MRHSKKGHNLISPTGSFHIRIPYYMQLARAVVCGLHCTLHLTHTRRQWIKKRKQMFWAATGKYGDGIHNKYINNMPPYSSPSPYLSLHLSPSPSPLYGFVYERVSANCQIIMWFIMCAIRLSFSFFFPCLAHYRLPSLLPDMLPRIIWSRWIHAVTEINGMDVKHQIGKPKSSS